MAIENFDDQQWETTKVTQTVKQVRALLLTVILPSLLISCNSSPQASSSAKQASQQLSGAIVASKWLGKEGDACDLNDSLNYKDLGSGTNVKVENSKGEIIALGKIGQGKTRVVQDQLYCAMSFSVIEVPDSDFYSITVGNGQRGKLSYSKAEIASKNWQIDLILQ